MEHCWMDYVRLLKGRETYSAIARLAEISNVLRGDHVGKREAEKWRAQLSEAEISTQMLGDVVQGLSAAATRLDRILGVGINFTGEELLLVLTIRVEASLVFEFLRDRGSIFDFDFSRIDEEMTRVAQSRENAETFRREVLRARNNWGIPIQSEWLGT
jgi:hypothetical protein